MVKLNDLYTVYHLARRNKRRSEDAVLFELNCEMRLHHLTEAINSRTYRANANYSFVTLRPKPREVFGCELEARIIQWYIIWRTEDAIEQTLTPYTYNNRKGMGVDAAIMQLRDNIIKASHNFTKEVWVFTWDLSGYFPNADCEHAYRAFAKIIEGKYQGEDKEDLLWMLMIAIHANPQAHCRLLSPKSLYELIEKSKRLLEKPAGTGGAIGFLIWQVGMNVYLDNIDHWAVDEMQLLYLRFVDDSALVTDNKEAALALLPLFRKKYKEAHCAMHPKKFYCQEVKKGVNWLGCCLKFERIYCNARLIRNALLKVRYFNRCHRKFPLVEKLLCSLNSFIGSMKHKTEYNNIKRIVGALSAKWLRFVHFDDLRVCFAANERYTHHKYIKLKFNRL